LASHPNLNNFGFRVDNSNVMGDVRQLSLQVQRTIINKLSAGTYLPWSFRIQRLARAKGLWEVITGTGSPDPNKDQQALDLISTYISDEHIMVAMRCSGGRELWELLKKQYANNSKMAQANAKQALATLRQEGHESITDYVDRIRTQRAMNTVMGIQVDDEEVIIILLTGLNEDYKSIRDTLMVSAQSLGLETMIQQLLGYEQMVQRSDILSTGARNAIITDTAYLTQRSGGARHAWKEAEAPGCPAQQQRPHRPERSRGGRQQWSRSGSGKPSVAGNGVGPKPMGMCRVCGKHGHWGDQCRSSLPDPKALRRGDYYASAALVLMAGPSLEGTESGWTIDSGATVWSSLGMDCQHPLRVLEMPSLSHLRGHKDSCW